MKVRCVKQSGKTASLDSWLVSCDLEMPPPLWTLSLNSTCTSLSAIGFSETPYSLIVMLYASAEMVL